MLDTLSNAAIIDVQSVEKINNIFNSLSWPVACCLTAIIITSMILKYLDKHPNAKNFVLRQDCHTHILGLKEAINNGLAMLHEDIREMRTAFNNHMEHK